MQLLVTIEAIAAGVALVLVLIPVRRAINAATSDVKTGSPAVVGLLATAVLAGAVLRLGVAKPTLLYMLPDAVATLDRLFFPLGSHATWHPHHGMGAFVIHAIAGAVLGHRLEVVWIVNTIAGILTVPALYLFVSRLTQTPLAGAFAALFLALYVPAIRVDVSDQLASLTNLALLLAGFSVFEALERPGRERFLEAAIAVGFAGLFRAETVIVFMALALVVLLSWRRLRGHGASAALALGVASLLAFPRFLTSFAESWRLRPDMKELRLDVLWDLLTGDWHLWLNFRYSAPTLVLLCVAGFAFLVRERRLAAAIYFLIAIGGTVYLCFNEWMLDFNDALRFQSTLWPPLAGLAGMGAAGVLSRVRRPSIAWGAGAGVAALSFAWIAPGLPLLRETQAGDVDLLFLAEHGRALPQECALFVQGRTPPAGGSEAPGYRTGWRPAWLVGRAGDVLPRYPEELPESPGEPGEGCRVAYVGVDCFRWYPDEIVADEWLREAYHEPDHPPLFRLVQQVREDFDRSSPKLPRPECAALFERYAMEPLVTTSVSPGRPTTVWSPGEPMEIGLYRLGPNPGPAHPAHGAEPPDDAAERAHTR